jgi:hypothetical protein
MGITRFPPTVPSPTLTWSDKPAMSRDDVSVHNAVLDPLPPPGARQGKFDVTLPPPRNRIDSTQRPDKPQHFMRACALLPQAIPWGYGWMDGQTDGGKKGKQTPSPPCRTPSRNLKPARFRPTGQGHEGISLLSKQTSNLPTCLPSRNVTDIVYRLGRPALHHPPYGSPRSWRRRDTGTVTSSVETM